MQGKKISFTIHNFYTAHFLLQKLVVISKTYRAEESTADSLI